jgi:hypothetical protein
MTGAHQPLPRRRVLQLATFGATATLLGAFDLFAGPPKRATRAAPTDPPSIQFDIDDYTPPAENVDGTNFRFGPVYTLFVTLRLTGTPTRSDQSVLEGGLSQLEGHYPFSPDGVFACVGYGIPYFSRLPGGMKGALVAQHMPRLLLDRQRFALEEAVPSPTDVTVGNPDPGKATFNIPLSIESNDLLLTLRSDVRENLLDTVAWLFGSNELNGGDVPSPAFAGLYEVTSTRLMFVQRGLPRQLADAQALPYAHRIHPESPMWMSFASQQADSSGPATIVTFQGNASAQFTNAAAGDYFADGAIQHLSHVILDLPHWYDDTQPYIERVQQMFRSNPPPATGDEDQFTDGGGPAFLSNSFQGRDDARQNAAGENTLGGRQRLGHTTALQRASRAADGTPLHLRIDGPGFDSLDVPGGGDQPKTHFSMFIPTAEVFERMRRYQAATDLAQALGVRAEANGLERFMTTTRRQNFLVPPRLHRALPLLELV